MNNIKYLVIICILLSCIIIGCSGKLQEDEMHSPKIVDFSLNSYNEGTEDKQYVQAILTFDKEVAVHNDKADSIRLTIADERVASSKYELTQGEDTYSVVCTVSVQAVTTGIYKIELSEKSDVISAITDVTGKYVVSKFSVEGIIPSGVTLSEVSQDVNQTVVQVDSAWNIRSIAWVKLTEDGETVAMDAEKQTDILDGAVAVHGHEFLIEDETTIAQSIVEVLTENYGKQYNFRAEGNQVIIEKKNKNSKTKTALMIYEYSKIQ